MNTYRLLLGRNRRCAQNEVTSMDGFDTGSGCVRTGASNIVSVEWWQSSS
jgi:hypothetical protein